MKKLWSLATVFVCATSLVDCSGNDIKDNNATTQTPTSQEGATPESTDSNEPVTFRFSWWGETQDTMQHLRSLIYIWSKTHT